MLSDVQFANIFSHSLHLSSFLVSFIAQKFILMKFDLFILSFSVMPLVA